MIEVLKQALEALEKSQSALAEELSAWDIDPPLHHVQESHDLCGPAITSIKEAIREHAMYEVQRLGQEIEQEPVAWSISPAVKGEDGRLYAYTNEKEWALSLVSKGYEIRPLVHGDTHPPQRTEPPDWFPAVENILNEYGLQAIDFVADFKAAMKDAEKSQRTWVGLTDEEITKIVNANSSKGLYLMAKAIETKLKDKNCAG